MRDFANLLRPQSIDDFVGQDHILKDSPLINMIQNVKMCHCFFYGAPGCGKSTLAKIIAKSIDSPIGYFNATSFKLEEFRKFISKFANSLQKPIILIDEVHRLNKTQQEVLLPIMENYEAYIIGTSTLNPFFTLTNAIRSRSFLFEFKPLDKESMMKILHKAEERFGFTCPKDVAEHVISTSGGDVRAMLNLLDILSQSKKIDLETAKSLRPFSIGEGASESDTHYNLISAMIKSIRGSDVDASVYYLARLIHSGENPEFIARRLVILSSEDIGNANPNALNIASSTLNAVSKIGYPESRIILSQCVIYLASSPKSNTAYIAIDKALGMIDKGEILEIPEYLLPNSPKSKDYKYPHDFGGYVKQKYMSKMINFVEPTLKGFEKTLNEWLEKIKFKDKI